MKAFVIAVVILFGVEFAAQLAVIARKVSNLEPISAGDLVTLAINLAFAIWGIRTL